MATLEDWILRSEQPLDSSLSALKLQPSLPWLLLSQWGCSQGALRAQLQASYRHFRFDLEHWKPLPADLEQLILFGQLAHDNAGRLCQALSYLLDYQPQALSVNWQLEGNLQGWVLRQGEEPQVVLPPPRRHDGLTVHCTWKPQGVAERPALEERQLSILEDFRQRSHFSPLPTLVQGRPLASDLDLSWGVSQRHTMVGVLAGPGQACLAAAPPIIYNPRAISLNGQLLHDQRPVNPGLAGTSRVEHYHLVSAEELTLQQVSCRQAQLSRRNFDHPELLLGIDCQGGPADFQRLALSGSQPYLLPLRRVGPSWMVRYSIRPYRAQRLFCLPPPGQSGLSWLLPVSAGILLRPIAIEGLPEGSLLICCSPPELETQQQDLVLLERPASRAWVQNCREQALAYCERQAL